MGDNSLEGWHTQAIHLQMPAIGWYTMSPGTSNYNYYGWGFPVGMFLNGSIRILLFWENTQSVAVSGRSSFINQRQPVSVYRDNSLHTILFRCLSAEQIKLINYLSTGIADNKVENVGKAFLLLAGIAFRWRMVHRLHSMIWTVKPLQPIIWNQGYYILRTNEKSYKVSWYHK